MSEHTELCYKQPKKVKRPRQAGAQLKTEDDTGLVYQSADDEQ